MVVWMKSLEIWADWGLGRFDEPTVFSPILRGKEIDDDGSLSTSRTPGCFD